MIENPFNKKKTCTNPKCVGGFIPGNPNGTPMEMLPSACPHCIPCKIKQISHEDFVKRAKENTEKLTGNDTF